MTGDAWRLDEVDGIALVRCAALERIPGVAHAFSTRRAFGRTDFDLRVIDRAAGDTVSREASFLRAAGFGAARCASIRQVHGNTIVDAASLGPFAPEADGVTRIAVQDASTPIPAVRTADCVAALIVARDGSAMAAVHAGWRGAAAGVAARGVAKLVDAGVRARDLVVALGPAILGCCYEVGDEVTQALGATCGAPNGFAAKTSSGRTAVDLHAALRRQLVDAGVPSEAIHAAPWCTRCRVDTFFSYRAEGPGGGRLLAAIGPAAGP